MTCVRVESIVTSLVFDHALRLRVKAETSDPKPTVDSASAPASGEPGVAIAPPTSETRVAAEDADLALVKDEEQVKTSAKGNENLSGKLNNLVTSDFGNLKNGNKFFLQLCECHLSDDL